MAEKTRVILLAVVLLSAGLAGCADTDDTDTDTGDTDTGDRDTDRDTRETDERDTGDRDTRDTEGFDRSFNDTIDEQNYVRNWTVPVNSSGANVSIEANLQGDAVDDFEATLFDPDDEEICTVTDSGGMDTLQPDEDGENTCEEELEDTGDHRLTVWGNSTADEADYTVNVTVTSSGDTGTMDDGTTGDTGGTSDDATRDGSDGDDGIYRLPVRG